MGDGVKSTSDKLHYYAYSTIKAPDKGEVGGSSPPRPTISLLHKSHVWCRAAFGHFLDGAELRLIARDILSQCPKNPLRMTRVDDHALQQLALLAVGKNINKVERKLFEVVVNHHQVAVLAL